MALQAHDAYHLLVLGRALLLVALPACTEISDNSGYHPDTIVRPGRIEHYGDPVVVDAPATASVGSPFMVAITTYGGGCIEPDRTDVAVGPAAADIRPFDREPVDPEAVCTSDLRTYIHETQLAFDTPGDKLLRFHGRRVAANIDEPIVYATSIEIE